METQVFLDYLQFSIPFEHMPFDSEYKNINPLPYYQRGYVGTYGERYYIGNKNSNNPLVIMSGGPLQRWSKIVAQTEFLQNIINNGAKISRIDMTMDCYISDDLIQPIDYVDWFLSEKIETCDTWHVPPKTISSWEKYRGKSVSNIETLYFGDWKKRGKRGIVRVYDKGIDLGQYANSIVRLEVEDKRDKAHVSAHRIADGASVGSVLKTRFNVLDDRWQSAIDSPSIDTTRGESEDDKQATKNAWNWLLAQVAPTLGKQLAMDELNEDSENFKLFNEIVQKNYTERLNELIAPDTQTGEIKSFTGRKELNRGKKQRHARHIESMKRTTSQSSSS